MKVAVLGGGAWGTAVASVLAHNNHDVFLWCYEDAVVKSIQKERCNATYLPGVELQKTIHPTTCFKEALTDAAVVFEAIPVPFLRSTLLQARPYYTPEQHWVVLSKGLEQKTLALPSAITQDVFGHSVQLSVLMGPSFAHDVVKKQITAVNLASTSKNSMKVVKQVIQNDYFIVEQLADMTGIQWCAVLKNCITVGIGILDGAGYTDNTKTFFLVQTLQEIKNIIERAGGDTTTIYSLSGIGDLMLTALGSHSRNLKAGKLKGQNVDNEQIKQTLGHLPEGFNALLSVHEWLDKHQVSAPLLEAMYEIVHEKKAHDQLVHALLKTV